MKTAVSYRELYPKKGFQTENAKIQFENIEFTFNGRYDRLKKVNVNLALKQVYHQSLKRLTLIFLRAGESLSFEVTEAHQAQVQELISGLALRLRNDSEWEPSPGEHCKRCTYQKHCGAVCAVPEPLPEGGRKVRLVQLALAV